MKNVSVLLSFLFLTSINCPAKILRVGYSGIPLSGTDFNTFQAAHDSASVGDTINLFPGSWNVEVHKRLVIIGKGYNTEGSGSNANVQNIHGVVNLNANLYTGSDSAIFYGVGDGTIRVYYNNVVNNIKIRRCRLSIVYFNDQVCNNWEISQSIIYSSVSYWWGGGLAVNLNISNCFINTINFSSASLSGLSGLFTNNIFANTNNNLQNGGFIFQNNIFTGADMSLQNSGNCFFQNNLAESASLLPIGNGNANNTNMANTFIGYPIQGITSDDGRYQLKAGSPAINAGYNGADAGMFGGINPYKLSGIPPVPSIYKLTAPGTVANGNPYTITVSIRSNN